MIGREAYDVALARYQKETGQAPGLPDELLLPYLCDVLGQSPAVVVEMDAEDIAAFSCYHEGKGLAEWCNATDPPAKQPRNGGR